MGLTDRFKDLKSKAEETVAEHNQQIQGAVEKASAAADKHTGGRYSEHIEKAGAKAGGLVDSFKASDGPPAGAEAEADAGADDTARD